MTARDGDLLPVTVQRAIGDKLYEKRKSAALEVEQLVKALAAQGNTTKINAIIDRLISDYASSPQANYRKGGLLCLAATAVGLANHEEHYLAKVIPPVLESFKDQDSRVRYYACEALFNIAKAAQKTFIMFFNEVFDALFALVADSDSSVQNAAQFLNGLIKDLVTGSSHFDLHSFIPLLQRCLTVTNPYKRQFLLSWVAVLDSVPDIDLLHYLPLLLPGLLEFLNDPHREIRQAANNLQQELLLEVREYHLLDWCSISSILVGRIRTILAIQSDQRSLTSAVTNPLMSPTSPATATPVTPAGADRVDFISVLNATLIVLLKWLREIVVLSQAKLVGSYPDILSAVLPSLSHMSEDVQQLARNVNDELLKLPERVDELTAVDGDESHEGPPLIPVLNIKDMLSALATELMSDKEQTRLAALHWVKTLMQRSEHEVLAHLDTFLPPLLDALGAPYDRVVLEALTVLASIAEEDDHFKPLLQHLIDRFRGQSGARLLQRRGSLIIRQLCAQLGPAPVLTQIASLLEAEEDLRFVSTMVQALNLILLTAPELREVRSTLIAAGDSPESAALFVSLYRCWAHSTGALLALLLLAQVYGHACDIINTFGTLSLGVEVLVQLDRLVQLLETPMFTSLRLQLLQPGQNPDLVRCMYGLLMLLPQSDAFKTLHARLHSLPTLALLQLEGGEGVGHKSKNGRSKGKSYIEYDRLLDWFIQIQEAHAAEEEQRQILPSVISTVSAQEPVQDNNALTPDTTAISNAVQGSFFPGWLDFVGGRR